MNQISNSLISSALSLSDFGTPTERVERAVQQIRSGGGVLVVDDEDRENEGDMIFAAESLTTEQMALLIREGTGIVCLCLPEEKLKALDLRQMVPKNTSSMGTAFTISIEAKEGVTTGVSASDRVQTIKTAIAEDAKPEDLASPGHVFPLRASPGGVAQRAGHTEAAIEFARLAGCLPAGVLCELTNCDGSMARLPEIMEFGKDHNMPVVTIADLIDYLAASQHMVA